MAPKKIRTPRPKRETLEQMIVRRFMEGESIRSLAWEVLTPSGLYAEQVDRTEEIIRKNMKHAAKLRMRG